MMSSEKSCEYELDEKSIEAVRSILRRGGDVEIRRRGNGYIILEVTKKIKYST